MLVLICVFILLDFFSNRERERESHVAVCAAQHPRRASGVIDEWVRRVSQLVQISRCPGLVVGVHVFGSNLFATFFLFAKLWAVNAVLFGIVAFAGMHTSRSPGFK